MVQINRDGVSTNPAEGIKQVLQKAIEGGLVTKDDFARFATATTQHADVQNVPFADGHLAAKGNVLS